MKYTCHNLRIGIQNAESSLRWFGDILPEHKTPYDHEAIHINMYRIAKYNKMLTSGKGFTPKY